MEIVVTPEAAIIVAAETTAATVTAEEVVIVMEEGVVLFVVGGSSGSRSSSSSSHLHVYIGLKPTITIFITLKTVILMGLWITMAFSSGIPFVYVEHPTHHPPADFLSLPHP